MKARCAGINDPSAFINKILLERLPSWPISKLSRVFSQLLAAIAVFGKNEMNKTNKLKLLIANSNRSKRAKIFSQVLCGTTNA